MADLLSLIEASALAREVRASTWLYPLANLAHVLGAALLLGAIAVFDLLMLRGRHAAAADVSGTALPVAATGLLLLAATGPLLFAAEATALGRNPAFLVKMGLVLVGLANLALFHAGRRLSEGFRAPPALHALVSLVVWTGVLLAGRSIAYV